MKLNRFKLRLISNETECFDPRLILLVKPAISCISCFPRVMRRTVVFCTLGGGDLLCGWKIFLSFAIVLLYAQFLKKLGFVAEEIFLSLQKCFSFFFLEIWFCRRNILLLGDDNQILEGPFTKFSNYNLKCSANREILSTTVNKVGNRNEWWNSYRANRTEHRS